MQFFIDVVLPLPLPKAFTYWVSEEEFEFLSLGHRVGVPFGKNKLYTGIVVKKHRVSPQTYTPKTIAVILDETPLVTPDQLRFWEWMASYYLCSLGSILRAALPGALLLSSETFIAKNPEVEVDEAALSDKAFLIMEALENTDLRIEEVQAIVDNKKVFPLINALAEKGYVQVLQSLREKYIPKKHRYFRLAPQHTSEAALQELFQKLHRAPKQSQLLLALCQIAPEHAWVRMGNLKKHAPVNSALLRTLCDKGILEERLVQEDRMLLPPVATTQPPTLSPAQANAKQSIENQWKEKAVVLLEGVTSSGKTAVYFELIAQQIALGNQVLYLLPEISLTAQMVQRLQKRFGDKVTVFHSRFSVHERVEVWHKILNNAADAQVIIGARSGLFLPFQHLGLIIVDEEHETSFKQFDPAPRYHARDAAIVLAQQLGCRLLLGSATPSVESRFNAQEGKYGYVTMKQRFGPAIPPTILPVDLKEAYKRKSMKGPFSPALFDSIAATLEAGEKVILFQNRRGYAPLLECHSCGHIPQCTNCDVSLTYHQSNQQLCCHYCGYSIAKPIRCAVCQSNDLAVKGTGTQQIEEQVQTYFPAAKVARMDWDTTRGKRAFEQIIDQFDRGEVNVLVGTQMVTKGLDFKKVGLVGVIQADALLYYPDFRAHERAFQILTQVAGRAGRTAGKSKVMIQSYSPSHPVLQQVVNNNYAALFEKELNERRTFDYPPFYRVIRLTIKARDYSRVDQAAQWLGQLLHQQLDVPILGPVDPIVPRIRNLYLKQLMIKFPARGARQTVKGVIVRSLKSFEAVGAFRSVKVNVDVDPV